jgi:ubiquinone biosynthesis protein Coq4
MEAFAAGYEAGRRAEPLVGLQWQDLWGTPLAELRERLGLRGGRIVGEGIRAAA